MSKIVVIGMGQGGMVAAIKLAEQGHSVCVYEQSEKGAVSYDWTDDIRSEIFEHCNLPMPSEEIYFQKNKWVFVSPNEKHRLPVPPCPPMEEISIYRRGLSEYFANLAQQAGCAIHYGAKVEKLLFNGDRVCGICANGREIPCDLVIDASGMRSPFRAQLPSRFGVQAQPENAGVLYTYRAFFKRTEGADPVIKGINSTVILKHLGGKGIGWCNLADENTVDVLIGRIEKLTDDEIKKSLASLSAYNPILSDELISERRVEVCLRASIARAVADGYIAIGDSAYMTMPIMGSGIEASMNAGKDFAAFVVENKITDFSASNMWKFYADYMRNAGSGFALIDVLKRWALGLDAKWIDWLFGSGIVTEDNLAAVSTDENAKVKISAKAVFKILAKPSFVFSALGCLSRGLKASRCAKHVPKRYDEKRLAKWQKKYEKRLHG
ncbi:MAG: FAD-binding protein [Clostridiales bacterium]|nr:FAD-binding protein [Clostridiales bacterium]